MGPLMLLSVLTSLGHLTLSATYFFLPKKKPSSASVTLYSPGLLPTPTSHSSLSILFQASFSLDVPHFLVLPSAH